MPLVARSSSAVTLTLTTIFLPFCFWVFLALADPVTVVSGMAEEGMAVSTVKSRLAGGSSTPSLSVARTSKLWAPSGESRGREGRGAGGKRL